MVICPRTKPGAPIQHSNGVAAGCASFNGTLLAGTLMVKQRDEWDALRQNPTQLDTVLSAIGYPPTDS